MKLNSLLPLLGEEVSAPDEETFDLFSQNLPSQSLGFVDSKSTTLELTIGGRDLTIHQSPGVLSSNRAGGTTGAVVWNITPLFAEWISSANNLFFSHEILSTSSFVLELGCGISGLVGLLLAPRITQYVLSDQVYVARFVEQNIVENQPRQQLKQQRKTKGGSNKNRSSSNQQSSSSFDAGGAGKIRFAALDWETDQVTPSLTGVPEAKSFDVVVACDCVYNLGLIEPFVTTCADACRLRASSSFSSSSSSELEPGGRGEGEGEQEEPPCVCIVAQQLRDPIVFEAWLESFAKSFHVWRVPDELLLEGLRSNSGFVVHMGVLKASKLSVGLEGSNIQ
ncbi:hypothetical protein B0H63DRAFT_118766 [Podospora didyma]|uniref:Diaminohydroxyphosphoribosylamino-pyrimidine deaminase n=1 Tax=Podospora didyma TaxID=330526 RepID=A0AAE0NZJ6_9PEZI|nr:hypothetical protein B0H63DRAFT_118766 [Podospora didyma]